jgi:hypothetical protein
MRVQDDTLNLQILHPSIMGMLLGYPSYPQPRIEFGTITTSGLPGPTPG